VVEYLFIHTPNVCTCISKPLTEYYEEHYGKHVYFIPNGINPVNPKDFDLEKAISFLPEGASINDPYILFAARRLMRTKGCHTMLQALARINYQGQVFIAGELDHNSKYLEELKVLSTGMNIYYLGFVNPLSALFALVEKSKLFIFPSETEGMSIMLLEVASVGKPLVVSDIPENTQVFHEDEVIYFKNKDPEDLALKITFALENEVEVEKMASTAKIKVLKDYNWENIAGMYAEIYENNQT